MYDLKNWSIQASSAGIFSLVDKLRTCDVTWYVHCHISTVGPPASVLARPAILSPLPVAVTLQILSLWNGDWSGLRHIVQFTASVPSPWLHRCLVRGDFQLICHVDASTLSKCLSPRKREPPPRTLQGLHPLPMSLVHHQWTLLLRLGSGKAMGLEILGSARLLISWPFTFVLNTL